jgi:hypothetical protein
MVLEVRATAFATVKKPAETEFWALTSAISAISIKTNAAYKNL